MKPYLICIVGPTAIGKTAQSIALAKTFNTEIISADSRQFYKEMTVGTAVPSIEELATVQHHFIQHISIDKPYSVGDFEQDALQELAMLFTKHRHVIMVGGSGLYVDAVTKGLDYFPSVKPKVREQLNECFEKEGINVLQTQLQQLDPVYAATVDMKNPRRIIRALEICLSSNKPYSSFLNQPKQQRPFKTLKIGLEAPREILYKRIEQRVDKMMAQGLLKEAKSLYPQRHKNALQTIGYKELFRYFDNEWTLDFAVSELKKNTRRFAKRQLTWFRRDPSIHWFPYNCKPQEIAAFIQSVTEKS